VRIVIFSSFNYYCFYIIVIIKCNACNLHQYIRSLRKSTRIYSDLRLKFNFISSNTTTPFNLWNKNKKKKKKKNKAKESLIFYPWSRHLKEYISIIQKWMSLFPIVLHCSKSCSFFNTTSFNFAFLLLQTSCFIYFA
jgi:hypothetical protein